MAMKPDVEIAQEAKVQYIEKIAEKVGLSRDDLEFYGKASLAYVGGTMIGRKMSLLPSASRRLPKPVHQKPGPTERFEAPRR